MSFITLKLSPDQELIILLNIVLTFFASLYLINAAAVINNKIVFLNMIPSML